MVPWDRSRRHDQSARGSERLYPAQERTAQSQQAMHFEVSLTVKAPRAKAYSAYTDFEAMPRWSKQCSSVRVGRSGGDTVRLEIGGGGRTVVRELRLFPPERVESEGETRLTRTKSAVTFEDVPGGTRVTASLDVDFKGRWGWVFRTRSAEEAESSAMEELASFAGYAESLR